MHHVCASARLVEPPPSPARPEPQRLLLYTSLQVHVFQLNDEGPEDEVTEDDEACALPPPPGKKMANTVKNRKVG